MTDANPHIGSNFDYFLAEIRGVKITRFRCRKARKPYRRRLLIPIRHRYRVPMVVRRYGLIARLR